MPDFDLLVLGDCNPDLVPAEGPRVAVKLGPNGALAARGDEIVEVAAPRGVEAIETTGAGDSFDAGVLAGLLGGGTGAQATRDEALDLLERAA